MNCVRNILFAGLVIASTVAFAGAPASKQPHPATTLRTAEEFAQLKPGDTIVYVCKQCDSVHVRTIEHRDQAMALCREGATVSCPACQRRYKTTFRGPRAKAGRPAEVTYVNEQGEECLFVAKLGADGK